MEEREAYIALNMMEGLGPVGVRTLVEHLGSARALFDVEPGTLQALGGGAHRPVRMLLDQRNTVPWRQEMDRAGQSGIRFVTPVDAEYPDSLRHIYDPPLALYVRGHFEARDRHAVAVVGTRHPTHYGLECAGRLSSQLSQAGFVVVSGLAEGIDTAAHQAVLRAKGRTVAVIGSGMACLYPSSNRVLADQISEGGAVVSEFPMDRKPDKTTFPIRNRIVSGLSMGVIVVEADLQSGAMITARQALEQGRTVFAVPGRVDQSTSRGPHDLIRNGARLISSIDDVLEEFEMLIPTAKAAQDRPAAAINDEERALLTALEEGEQDVDALIRSSGLKPGTVSSLLIGLEMKRLIRMLPGRRVAKITP
jgi:DNA processing protein